MDPLRFIGGWFRDNRGPTRSSSPTRRNPLTAVNGRYGIAEFATSLAAPGRLHPAPSAAHRTEAKIPSRATSRYSKRMLVPFGKDLYFADGPTVSFFGFPYPTRMAAVRLSTGTVWVWSPIALTNELASAVEAIGRVSYIVSPNKLHHLFLPEWSKRWPDARLYAPPGLARKRKQLHFDAQLGDQSAAPWMPDIDQVLFRGSFAMQEVVFFHRTSRTAIFGDLIQRFAQAQATGCRGMIMRLAGLVGRSGSTPYDLRLSFLSREGARAARRAVLEWKPQRLLIAHGECATSGATELIAAALHWI